MPYSLSGSTSGSHMPRMSATGNGGKVGYYEHSWATKRDSTLSKSHSCEKSSPEPGSITKQTPPKRNKTTESQDQWHLKSTGRPWRADCRIAKGSFRKPSLQTDGTRAFSVRERIVGLDTFQDFVSHYRSFLREGATIFRNAGSNTLTNGAPARLELARQ